MTFPLSPIKEFRNYYGLSLSVLAAKAGTTPLSITRTEQAVFTEVPPSVSQAILSYDPITTSRGFALTDADSLQEAYVDYQQLVRRSSHGLLSVRLPAYKPGVSPLVHWRLTSSFPTQMGFCRAFCVHPGPVASFERGLQRKIPDQVRTALGNAGYESEVIDELQSRQHLFVNSRRKFQ